MHEYFNNIDVTPRVRRIYTIGHHANHNALRFPFIFGFMCPILKTILVVCQDNPSVPAARTVLTRLMNIGVHP
jgi:hypothetical protein